MKFLIPLLLFSSLTFAGDKGNGGISLVCRNEANEIISAELLDLYEGKILGGKNYSETRNIQKKLDEALTKIDHALGFQKLVSENISYVQANMIFIPSGHELLPTDDALPIVKKNGCKFEQLANFTNDGDVYVSQEIYEKLDLLNKAALILHEAVYASRRVLGDQNSQKSRRVVYELLADDTNINIVNKLIRPSELRPGLYQSMFKDGCLLELSDDGWSFKYYETKPRYNCSKETFHFEPTEEKNVFIFSGFESWFKVTGKDSFKQANFYDWIRKNKGTEFKRIK